MYQCLFKTLNYVGEVQRSQRRAACISVVQFVIYSERRFYVCSCERLKALKRLLFEPINSSRIKTVIQNILTAALNRLNVASVGLKRLLNILTEVNNGRLCLCYVTLDSFFTI